MKNKPFLRCVRQNTRKPQSGSDSSPQKQTCRNDGFFWLAVVTLLAIAPGTVAQTPTELGDRALSSTLSRLIRGPAFDAKIRQTVWAGGQEVVGVGTLTSGGQGSGRYRMQITMHDGIGKHLLSQYCDGRLAWTRSEVSGIVSLRRVDVSRLDSWIQESQLSRTHSDPAERHPVADPNAEITPGKLVGGPAEMIHSAGQQFNLTAQPAKLAGHPVWVLSGDLKDEIRLRTLDSQGLEELAELHPTQIRIVIAAEDDLVTGFGKGLPVRIEYWSDPIEDPNAIAQQEPMNDSGAEAAVHRPARRRMISLVEFHSLRRITPPDALEFRYENHDREVDIINETDLYLQNNGIQLTDAQRNLLRR